MMKIMFLTGTYYPAQDGVAHVTQYLAEGLAERHEVHVITALGASTKQHERYKNVNIERIRVRRNLFCRFVGDRRKLYRSISECRPDCLIVVGIQNWTFDWLKGKLNRMPGKKVLMTHGCSCLREYRVTDKIRQVRFRKEILADLLSVYMEWYWKRYQKNFPKGMARFDLVTYLYDRDELYLHMRRFPVKQEMIVENAAEEFFFAQKAYASDGEEVVFINVSNYEPRKNQELVLRAYYEADIPDARLLLIGSRENGYYDSLISLNERLYKTDRHVCRQAEIYVGLSRSKVLELYRDANVYVSASKWEAMSISVCEAAAAGLAILATHVGHVAEIPGVHFFEEQTELTALMRQMYQNPRLRRESGREAGGFAESKYRISVKVAELEKKLREL